MTSNTDFGCSRMATVLRRGHSARGKALLVAKRLKDDDSEIRLYARTSRDVRTEDLTEDQIKDSINNLTQSNAADLLSVADKQETLENLRRALHFSIVIANEQGQKRPVPNEPEEPGKPENDMDVGSLVKRMKSLEQERKVEREEMAKAQVRTLATTSASKEQLLAGIDSLITAAENNDSKDLPLYRELRMQAFDTSVSIHNVCRHLFTTPCNDRLLTAVKNASKQDKEKTKKDDNEKSENAKPQPVATVTSDQQNFGPWFNPMSMMQQSPL